MLDKVLVDGATYYSSTYLLGSSVKVGLLAGLVMVAIMLTIGGVVGSVVSRILRRKEKKKDIKDIGNGRKLKRHYGDIYEPIENFCSSCGEHNIHYPYCAKCGTKMPKDTVIKSCSCGYIEKYMFDKNNCIKCGNLMTWKYVNRMEFLEKEDSRFRKPEEKE